MTQLYRYSPEFLQGIKADLEAGVAENTLLPVMVKSTIARIKSNPLAYLEFGPYWWSVKRLLRENGQEFGITDNALLANDYSFGSPELTLIAAWECADTIRASYFRGSREFALTDDGESVITLFDPDMETQQ